MADGTLQGGAVYGWQSTAERCWHRRRRTHLVYEARDLTRLPPLLCPGIDEFDKMSSEHQALLGAMEQQVGQAGTQQAVRQSIANLVASACLVRHAYPCIGVTAVEWPPCLRLLRR